MLTHTIHSTQAFQRRHNRTRWDVAVGKGVGNSEVKRSEIVAWQQVVAIVPNGLVSVSSSIRNGVSVTVGTVQCILIICDAFLFYFFFFVWIILCFCKEVYKHFDNDPYYSMSTISVQGTRIHHDKLFENFTRKRVYVLMHSERVYKSISHSHKWFP